MIPAPGLPLVPGRTVLKTQTFDPAHCFRYDTSTAQVFYPK